jgi:putative FmdB family regulatory protein
MPTYEYECDNCSHSFEILQLMLDQKLKKCPECNKLKLHRLIGSGAGIIFKGSGFYETDYKKSSAPSTGGKSDSNKAKEKSKTQKGEEISKK